MFGFFKRETAVDKLERSYREKLAEAEASLAKTGDRALHGRLTTEAEAIGRELDAARADA